MTKKAVVIGAGFAGLSSACYLAKLGYKVTVFEKNQEIGGRARKLHREGFTFDLGPSWYWMPDVFEKAFNDLGRSTSDFYKLERLSPSYKVIFEDNSQLNVPDNLDAFYELFESIEVGSSKRLKKFLKDAKYKYEVGINEMVQKPGLSILEFMNPKLLIDAFRLNVFQDFHSYIRKYFKNPKLLKLLEFPILFLGALPKNTPALYSLMNYADIVLGTWYPIGGMSKVVDAFVEIANDLGVEFKVDHSVNSFNTEDSKIKSINTNHGTYEADFVVGSADYEHLDQKVTEEKLRSYKPKYWKSRKLAPSALIYYIAVDKKLPNLEHHNLFFDEDFERHSNEIYTSNEWPKAPLLYVSVTSKTDNTVAPEGKENIVVLIPVSTELEDSEKIREKYFNYAIDKLEKHSGTQVREHVLFKESYANSNFKTDYNSFKGNAYGLANTLDQTAILKPRMKSKKIKNLFFTGQLTVPGPGVPPSIISGEVVSKVIKKSIKL